MNKVILMGRLTKNPEVRYSQGNEPVAVAKYTLAVNRRFKQKGKNEAETDFISCVAFGKAGEFAEKYFKKGQQISIVGRLQVSSYEDREGKRRWSTDVVVEEQYFCAARNAGGEADFAKQSTDHAESKKEAGAAAATGTAATGTAAHSIPVIILTAFSAIRKI